MTEREPGNAMGFIGLANVLAERGALDESLALLARAEALDRSLPSIPVGRAKVASQRGEWATVLAECDRALQIDPQLMTAHLLRAVALLRTRRLDEADRELEPLRRQYPGHPDVGRVRGE